MVALPQLGVGGSQAGQPELAAELGLALDQGDVVAGARGLDRRGGAGRSGSDDEQAPGVPPRGGRRWSRPRVSSRPVRALTAQPIGTPAW